MRRPRRRRRSLLRRVPSPGSGEAQRRRRASRSDRRRDSASTQDLRQSRSCPAVCRSRPARRLRRDVSHGRHAGDHLHDISSTAPRTTYPDGRRMFGWNEPMVGHQITQRITSTADYCLHLSAPPSTTSTICYPACSFGTTAATLTSIPNIVQRRTTQQTSPTQHATHEHTVEDGVAIVGTRFGHHTTPASFHDLLADPRAEINTMAGEECSSSPVPCPTDQYDAMMPRPRHCLLRFPIYTRITARRVPILVLQPSA